MGSIDILIHSLNFAAPAIFLALLLAGASRVFGLNRAAARTQIMWVAINLVAGVAVLAGGLWVFGRDGKMASYAVLAGLMASVQWLSVAGWRR